MIDRRPEEKQALATQGEDRTFTRCRSSAPAPYRGPGRGDLGPDPETERQEIFTAGLYSVWRPRPTDLLGVMVPGRRRGWTADR